MTDSNQIDNVVPSLENVSSLSDSQIDTYFDQMKNEPNQVNQETDNAERNDVTRGEEHPIREDEDSSERDGRDATERSGEDGREERDPDEVPPNDDSNRHERNYKAALKEEREKRKLTQQELVEARENVKKMTAAFEKMVSVQETKLSEPQQPQIPSMEDDPIGHLTARLEEASKKINDLSQSNEKIITSTQQQKEMQQFMNDYSGQTQRFTQDQPDYANAHAFLRNELKQDYVLQGLTEDQAEQAINNQEIVLAAQQMTQRNNPAKVIYEMAKRRGYDSDAKSSNAKSNVNQNNENNIDKMDRLERGSKASRSITNKGVSSNSRMTLEEIASLSEDDFDKMDWNKVLQMG